MNVTGVSRAGQATAILDGAMSALEHAKTGTCWWRPSHRTTRYIAVNEAVEQIKAATQLLQGEAGFSAHSARLGQLELQTGRDGTRMFRPRIDAVIDAVRTERQTLANLDAAGLGDGVAVQAQISRLSALDAWAWTADDLELARTIDRNVIGGGAADYAHLESGIDTTTNTQLEHFIKELQDAGTMPDIEAFDRARVAQVYRSVWSHPTTPDAAGKIAFNATPDTIKARLLELSHTPPDEMGPDEWAELHALVFDMPVDRRVPELRVGFIPTDEGPELKDAMYKIPGFKPGKVDGFTNAAVAHENQAVARIASLRSGAPADFQAEIGGVLGDGIKTRIMFQADPGYDDLLIADLKKALTDRKDVGTIGHTPSAIGVVAQEVVDESTGLERARRAADLFEYSNTSVEQMIDVVRQELKAGSLNILPEQVRTQMGERLALNAGRIDGTVPSPEEWLRVPDFAELGAVRESIELAELLTPTTTSAAADHVTEAAIAAARTPAARPGTAPRLRW